MAAVLSVGDGAALLSEITGAVSDNITEVLVILGGVVGLKYAFKFINGAVKGRARI